MFSRQRRPFTELVREAARGREPRRERVEEALEALRGALRAELRRRGLWSLPPSYLGVVGWKSWAGGGSAAGAGGPAAPADKAFEELVGDCYAFIFVARLRSLAAQLRVRENIDGLVFLNIDHFLLERQKEHDPLGYRVFEVVRQAVRNGLAGGLVALLEGDPAVRNDSALVFPGAAGRQPCLASDLRSWVGRAADELLPELITARGKHQDAVAEQLARRLTGLAGEGVGAFRFKDLVDLFKAEVRERWAAWLEAEEGVGIEAEADESWRRWLERPGKRYEERESWKALVNCVLAALERIEVPEATRSYLGRLWQFLRVQSTAPVQDRDSEGGAEAEGMGAMGAGGRRRRGAERPSDRTLAELLRIPRRQLPELFATLGKIVMGCRSGGALPRGAGDVMA